tara:strand:+ start:12739 stop:13131 length:393 start_codon:yes stop_codon:yes gene_type:complete
MKTRAHRFITEVGHMGTVYNLIGNLHMDDIDCIVNRIGRKYDKYMMYMPKSDAEPLIKLLDGLAANGVNLGSFEPVQTLMFCERSFNRSGITIHIIISDIEDTLLVPYIEEYSPQQEIANKSVLIRRDNE